MGISRTVDEQRQSHTARLSPAPGASGVRETPDPARGGQSARAHTDGVYRGTASDIPSYTDDEEELDLEIISPLLADAADRQRRRRQWRGRGQEVDPSKATPSPWQRKPFGALDNTGSNAPGESGKQKADDRGRHVAPPNPGDVSEGLSSPRRRRHPALGNLPRQIRRGHLKAVPRPDEET